MYIHLSFRTKALVVCTHNTNEFSFSSWFVYMGRWGTIDRNIFFKLTLIFNIFPIILFHICTQMTFILNKSKHYCNSQNCIMKANRVKFFLKSSWLAKTNYKITNELSKIWNIFLNNFLPTTFFLEFYIF